MIKAIATFGLLVAALAGFYLSSDHHDLNKYAGIQHKETGAWCWPFCDENFVEQKTERPAWCWPFCDEAAPAAGRRKEVQYVKPASFEVAQPGRHPGGKPWVDPGAPRPKPAATPAQKLAFMRPVGTGGCCGGFIKPL